MTAASLLAPVLPPAPSPVRPAQGEGAGDGAGLFALLLAGPQPLQADVAQGGEPTARPAPGVAPALAGDCARAPAGPTPATHPQAPPLTSGTVGAEAPSTVPAAPALPPALPVPAQAGSGQGSPIPQLAAASPPAGSPVPAFAQSADRTRTAPAPHPTLIDPSPSRTQVAGETAAPLPPTVAPVTRAAATPFDPLHTASTPPAPPEAVPIALAADAQVPLPPRAWPLQTGAPRAATDPLHAQSRVSLSAAAGDRSIAAPAAEVRPPHAAVLAPTSGTPGPAADQPADDQVWLAPRMEAPEGAVARSEQAATEPARATAPGRSAPPAPMVQIGVRIAGAAPARIDRLFVQLEPASLGRVEVRLEFHRDNQVSAVIAAERPDTLDALQRDARVLERSLHQAGVRLDSDGLTFSLKREQTHDQPREDRPLAPAGDLGDQPLLAAHGHAPPPVQWFRSLRALDITV